MVFAYPYRESHGHSVFAFFLRARSRTICRVLGFSHDLSATSPADSVLLFGTQLGLTVPRTDCVDRGYFSSSSLCAVRDRVSPLSSLSAPNDTVNLLVGQRGDGGTTVSASLQCRCWCSRPIFCAERHFQFVHDDTFGRYLVRGETTVAVSTMADPTVKEPKKKVGKSFWESNSPSGLQSRAALIVSSASALRPWILGVRTESARGQSFCFKS